MTRAAYPSTDRPLRHARRPAAPPRAGRRRIAFSCGLAGVLVLGTAGLASAYWRTTGSGSGSSTAATALTLSATPITVTGLYPGGSKPTTFTVTATGSTAGKPITVTSVLAGTATVSPGTGACSATSAAFTVDPATLPAIGAAGSIVLNGTVSMPADADDGCQGRTFTIPLTVNGQQ